MTKVDKKELKEQEIRTMFITPALKEKGWEVLKNMREEYYFMDGCVNYYLFNSKMIQDYWDDRLAGSTNQKELYIGTLYDTIILISSLSEQHRIVAKIEELLAKLNDIEKPCRFILQRPLKTGQSALSLSP